MASEITKEQFAAYERVRQSGRYNMRLDSLAVFCGAAALTARAFCGSDWSAVPGIHLPCVAGMELNSS